MVETKKIDVFLKDGTPLGTIMQNGLEHNILIMKTPDREDPNIMGNLTRLTKFLGSEQDEEVITETDKASQIMTYGEVREMYLKDITIHTSEESYQASQEYLTKETTQNFL
tara:strand:+ start:11702 stop:12034 length:333 start_codon:yes stop_codon:yes gene_type:complete